MKKIPHQIVSLLGRLCFGLLAIFVLVAPARAVMQVTNGKLYDSSGNPFVIRGTNCMTLYWDGYSSDGTATGDWSAAGEYTFSQMTQTGANSARIFWHHTEGSKNWRIPATALDATIGNCIANNLLPIPELHNVTGDASLTEFQKCIDYWTSADIAAVFKKYENTIILNIVNEWNVPGGTDTDYRNAYGPAITAIRNAGINCPIMIDAGKDYAAEESTILNNAAYLINLDPKHNLIFSIHIYDPSSTDSNNRGSQARIKRVMDSMISNNICFIWGEFNRYGYGNAATEWQYLINYAQTTNTGWLAWAWWDVTDIFSLVYNKQFRAWDNDTTWSKGVTLTETNGIQQTAVKTLTLPQQDALIPVSNASLPANPVTIAFSGRSTVWTVDSSISTNRQGASILQQAYTGANSQKWNLVADGNGYYKIVSVGSGKVVEVAGGSMAVLANVQQGTDFSRNFQRWSITNAGTNLVNIRVRHSGQSPVTESDTTTDGAPVETYTFGGNTFTITGVGSPAVVPTLTTTAVTSIAQTTATSGGNATADGGANITARGVCWSTSANPTTANSKTSDGTGTGSFTSSITGLTANTTYHVRSYATNSAGTGYGSDVSFTTLATTVVAPTVTTTAVTSVAQTTATSGGNVTSAGNGTVTARGVCWSTSANPTTANSKTSDSTGPGTFTSAITGLTANTTYHVRAYATNSAGTGYGSDVSFTTTATTSLPTGWSDADIGSPGATGSGSYSGSTYTLVGSGTDIWDTSDQFNYASTSVSGDQVIIAKVASLTNTNAWAKAGVMMRDGIAANAMFADVVVTPTSGVSFQWRTTTGGSCAMNLVTGTPPQWVKLTRSGNNFTAAYSPDGTTWTAIGGTQTIAMASSYKAGLAVTAHNYGTLCTATFTNVSITGAADTANCNFETDAQGWAGLWTTTYISSVASSTDRAFAGTHSLKAVFNNTSGTAQNLSVGTYTFSGLTAGKTVTIHFYVVGTGVTSFALFSQTGTAYTWNASSVNNPATGSWQTLTLTIPAAAGAIDSLGYQIGVNAGATPTVYIDTITW